MNDLVTDVEWDEISGSEPPSAAERLLNLRDLESLLGQPYRQLDMVFHLRRHDRTVRAWLVRLVRWIRGL